MKPTMQDVARRAGTSIATVSKSLRGVATIPPATRQRICRIAEEMGYQVHPYIAALMKNRRARRAMSARRPVLAYVTAHSTEHGWLDVAFFKSLYAGAKQCADRRGYHLTPLWLHRDGMSNQRFTAMLWARGIRGLLLNPFPTFGTRLELGWEKFAVVAHGLSLASPMFHRTSNDHHQSMMLAMTECRRLGYERPGFILDATTSRRLEYRWEAAFHVAAEKLGFKRKIGPHLVPVRWQPEVIAAWIRQTKPDVVICLALERQIPDLPALGIRIPDDIGLVSLSVAHEGSPLSGICQNPEGMGAVAVTQLITMLERNETGIPSNPITLTIDGRWNSGRTTRTVAT